MVLTWHWRKKAKDEDLRIANLKLREERYERLTDELWGDEASRLAGALTGLVTIARVDPGECERVVMIVVPRRNKGLEWCRGLVDNTVGEVEGIARKHDIQIYAKEKLTLRLANLEVVPGDADDEC